MDYNEKIIDEISKELNIPRSKVEHVTKFFFNWQREKFIECENTVYKWNYFGKFSIMESRYNKYIEEGIIENPSKMRKELNKTKNKENKL